MTLVKSKEEEKLKTRTDIQKVQKDLDDISSYLDSLLFFLPLPICDISPMGVIVSVNKSFETFSGFNAIDIIGKRLDSMFLEKTRIAELLSLTKKEGIIKNQKLFFLSAKKKRIPVDISLSVKKDQENRLLIGYFVSITDVSLLEKVQIETEKKIRDRTKELKLSRRALLNILEDTEATKTQIEEERNRTQIILNNFLDGLLIFNSQKILKSINPKAEGFLDIKREKILNKSIAEFEKYPRTKDLIKIIKKKGEKTLREEMKLSEELTIEATVQQIDSIVKGEKTDVLIILHDITREKVIERLKSQFVSVAAHQLRTPLSIIKWSLSMLIEGELGPLIPEQKEILVKTNETNERMIRLINDLLNVARIEEGRFIYRPKTVDFTELLQTVIEPLQMLADKKKINLKVNVAKSKASKIIKGDTEKLALSIKNLVENAISYTNSGGSVTISLKRKDDQVEFSVKDTGIGIPKDQINRVFSKFFRADNAVRTETEGTGLGLFIVKNIVEAHKGKVWFESEEKKGTTFSFSLPAID